MEKKNISCAVVQYCMYIGPNRLLIGAAPRYCYKKTNKKIERCFRNSSDGSALCACFCKLHRRVRHKYREKRRTSLTFLFLSLSIHSLTPYISRWWHLFESALTQRFRGNRSPRGSNELNVPLDCPTIRIRHSFSLSIDTIQMTDRGISFTISHRAPVVLHVQVDLLNLCECNS